jgi:hypothetical protein
VLGAQVAVDHGRGESGQGVDLCEELFRQPLLGLVEKREHLVGEAGALLLIALDPVRRRHHVRAYAVECGQERTDTR